QCRGLPSLLQVGRAFPVGTRLQRLCHPTGPEGNSRRVWRLSDVESGLVFDQGFFAGNPDINDPERELTIDRGTGRVSDFLPPHDLYNFAPVNYYQRSNERYNVQAFGNYDFNATTRLYTEFGFHNDATVGQIAESGMFGVPAMVRWENPLLSA